MILTFTWQPLVDELINLRDNGVVIYDASKKEIFKTHVVVLWKINDVLSYANLSCWATYVDLVCPVCKTDTHYCRLKNGESVLSWATVDFYHPNMLVGKINHPLMGNKSSVLLQRDYLAWNYCNSWNILKKYHSGKRNKYVR